MNESIDTYTLQTARESEAPAGDVESMMMKLSISSVDYAPEELHDQLPISVDLVRQIPGDDRPDYWLGIVREPLKWLRDNREEQVTHVVIAARSVGTSIANGVENIPVAIAYVTDQSLIDDRHLDFAKISYVAIGIATEVSGGNPPRQLKAILSGFIGKAFGRGGSG